MTILGSFSDQVHDFLRTVGQGSISCLIKLGVLKIDA